VKYLDSSWSYWWKHIVKSEIRTKNSSFNIIFIHQKCNNFMNNSSFFESLSIDLFHTSIWIVSMGCICNIRQNSRQNFLKVLFTYIWCKCIFYFKTLISIVSIGFSPSFIWPINFLWLNWVDWMLKLGRITA